MAKILLIDDEVSVLNSIGLILRSEGHQVETISDGHKAVEAVKAGDYDLVITDIRMTPIDGMQILKIAHDSHPAKPVIIVSAYSSENTVQQASELGCVAYIKKPFRVQQVQDAVLKAMSIAKPDSQAI